MKAKDLKENKIYYMVFFENIYELKVKKGKDFVIFYDIKRNNFMRVKATTDIEEYNIFETLKEAKIFLIDKLRKINENIVFKFDDSVENLYEQYIKLKSEYYEKLNYPEKLNIKDLKENKIYYYIVEGYGARHAIYRIKYKNGEFEHMDYKPIIHNIFSDKCISIYETYEDAKRAQLSILIKYLEKEYNISLESLYKKYCELKSEYLEFFI